MDEKPKEEEKNEKEKNTFNVGAAQGNHPQKKKRGEKISLDIPYELFHLI